MSTIIYDRGSRFEQPYTPPTSTSFTADSGDGSLHCISEDLEKAKVYLEEELCTFYIPRCRLREIISYGTVRSALQVLSPTSNSYYLDDISNTICGKPSSGENKPPGDPFRRLFGVLVYIGHAKDIFDFIAGGMSDSLLPMSTTRDRGRLISSRASGRRIEMPRPRDWGDRVLDDFLRIQFAFISPYFFRPRDNTILQYHLDKDEILPILSRHAHPQDYYESAIVERVELHPQHYDFGDYDFRNPEAPRQLFALKSYTNFHRFQAEVNFANRIRAVNNDHLNRLLVSFKMPRMNCLIFPWAECDMSSYWASHAPETWDTKWIARQCCGLVSALAAIHNDAESQVHAGLPRDRMLYGRHGDIKPSNILWFKNHSKYKDSGGILVLNDFEFACFHRESSRSKTRASSVLCDSNYTPPELGVENGFVDRSFDIWCLGATFIELVTWLVRGYKAVQKDFIEARSADMHYGGHRSESFFRYTKKYSGAEVKPSVNAWIKGLQAEIRTRLPSAAFFDSLLSIVESDMLVVDAKRRVTAKELEVELSRLYEGN